MQTRFNATVLFPLVLLSCVLQSLATLAAEPASKEESFTVVLLPDTQYYSQKYPDTYVAQTLWIRKRLKEDNIKFAIHLGDIVQNPTVKVEWDRANQAMAILDDVVPYSVVPGNHDMVLAQRDSRAYNMYFPQPVLPRKNGMAATWARPTTITIVFSRQRA